MSLLPLSSSAQASPTATRGMLGNVFGPLSVFGTAGETDLGFGGQNTSVTGGANLRFRPLFGIEPGVEFRATLPVHSGNVAGAEDFLYGPVLRARYRALHPYANFLIGRGALNYSHGGYLDAYGIDLYTKSFSAIHAPGVGVDIDLTPDWAVKADAQYQLWSSIPVVAGGEVRSVSVTLGAQWRVHMPDRRYRKAKPDIHDGTWTPLHPHTDGTTQSPAGNNPAR